MVAQGTLGAWSSLLVGPLPLHVPPAGGEEDAGGRGVPANPCPYPSYTHLVWKRSLGLTCPTLTCWASKSRLPWVPSQLLQGYRVWTPDWPPSSSLDCVQLSPPLGSAHPLPPGLPRHSRGLIVANQQVDIGLLNALELLTEVGTTANPLCLGPDHLKEGKPNSLACARWLLASVSLHQPSMSEERRNPICKIQVPEDTQLQDKTLNRGLGGKLSQAAYSPLPTTHTISLGLSPSENLPL